MEKIDFLEKSIIEKLPQIPYIIDQVGEAFKWAKEELTEGDYIDTLTKASFVTDYTTKVSENNFFKTHLVIASILQSIPKVLENERFKIFDTASKSVENTLKKIIVDEKVVLERGCFKALSMHLIPLAKEDQDLFVIMLYGILMDLKNISSGMQKAGVNSPITQQDYITILGYANVQANIYATNVPLYNETRVVFNEIGILLNELKY